MRKVWTAAGWVLGIVSALLTLLVLSRDDWKNLYPGGVIFLLAVALIVVLLGWLNDRRSQMVVAQPHMKEDQEHLDRVFTALPRAAIRALDETAHIQGWRASVPEPFMYFANDHDVPEYAFRDPELEEVRQRLLRASAEYLNAEAMNGFPSYYSQDRRNIGWSEGEIEGLPDREKIARQRAKAIDEPTDAVVEAHAALVSMARDKGFTLTALDSPAPRLRDES